METEIQNSHGARPVNQVIQSMWWTRTSRLSMKNSLSLSNPPRHLRHAKDRHVLTTRGKTLLIYNVTKEQEEEYDEHGAPYTLHSAPCTLHPAPCKP